MKRMFDFVAAITLAIILSPLILMVALLIRVFDGAPVLFVQRRVGKGGRDFEIWKFRTMSARPPSAVQANAKTGSFEPGDRSRVTRLGGILRKLKLDELPQLWNVLRGEMSLVGPRPEVRKWVDTYPERWRVVHSICPGVTDPASIEFRNEEELLAGVEDPETAYRDTVLPRKLTIYEDYVSRHNFFDDLRILVKTVFVVFRK